MATTVTPRLGLKKQAAGDNPGAWEVDLNAGFDDADAAFFLSGTVTPNDPGVESTYIGQRYYDSVTGLWWTATEIADPSTAWVSDLTTLDAAITHPDSVEIGALVGTLEWLNATDVILRPLHGTVLLVDISGTGVTNAGAITFDIANDREGAQTEDASTPYYLYLDNLTTPGTLFPLVSKTPPDNTTGTKPGYHPTLVDHRCVGSIFNDSGLDLAKFTMENGFVRYDDITRDHTDFTHGLNLSGQSALRSQSVNLPETATMMQIAATLGGATSIRGVYMAFAKAGATTTGFPSAGPYHALNDSEFVECAFILQSGESGQGLNTKGSAAATFELDNATPATPVVLHGHNLSTDPANCDITILGYQDQWAPKF